MRKEDFFLKKKSFSLHLSKETSTNQNCWNSPQRTNSGDFEARGILTENHVKHYLVQLALPPLRNLGLFQTELAEALKHQTLLLCRLVGCLIVSEKKNIYYCSPDQENC